MSKPLEPNELKALKGQEVWLIPKYNAINRGKPLSEQITSDIVEKCGSKMFYLVKKGRYSFEDYCNEANYGFAPFKSKQDALDYLEIGSFLSALKSKDLSHLDIDDVKKIKEIIEGKPQQKVTAWYLVSEDESHYSCNNCKYDFHLANESSLYENSINFCPSCGYEIKEIIESKSQQDMQ